VTAADVVRPLGKMGYGNLWQRQNVGQLKYILST
jgi:hypothetical protein